MNENTKPLFSFTKFTLKHLLFLFIYPIIVALINNLFRKKVIIYKKRNNFEKLFMVSIGDIIINGIILIIKKIKKEKDNVKFDTQYNNIFILFFIIITLIIDYVQIYFYMLLNYNEYYYFFKPIEFIFLCIFSIFILKFEIYKHHYLSILIATIGLFIINILDFEPPFILSFKILLMCIVSIYVHFLYSLEDIICHYILYIRDIDINIFLLLIGISRLIFGFILAFINNYKFLNLNLFDEFSYILQKDLLNIILHFIYCLTYAIEHALIILTFKLFKPWFFAIFNSVQEIIYFLVLDINDFKNTSFIPKLLLMFLILFSYLIFSELIICNFCELNKNTKIEIMNREYNENVQLLTFNQSFNSDNEH